MNPAPSMIWKDVDDFPNFPMALCRASKHPLWDFQINDSERYLPRSRRHNKAIRICKKCIHAEACFLWGTENEMQGVWGGKVLIPNGRSYFRCEVCGYAMIKSRFQKPPRGFRNRYSNTLCTICAKI